MVAKVSTKSVIQKLGLKTGSNAAFLNIPKNLMPIFKAEMKGASKKVSGGADFLLGFYDSLSILKKDLVQISKILNKSGMAWVCWRKGGVTELNRDGIAELAHMVKLETVASCSIDEEWSALKLMFPKDQRQ